MTHFVLGDGDAPLAITSFLAAICDALSDPAAIARFYQIVADPNKVPWRKAARFCRRRTPSDPRSQ